MKKEHLQLARHLQTYSDVDFAKYDDHFLMQSIERRIEACGTNAIAEYLDILANNQEEVSNLILSLNVTYTDFFRNTLTYAHLEQWLLPAIIKSKTKTGELRIWVAGCSTGQEPYSIAILVERLQAMSDHQIRYRIFATDHDESALQVAQRGIYQHNEIQNVRYKDVMDFFIKKKEQFAISPEIRSAVSFSHFDLLHSDSAFPEASIFGNFDLVVCCNLLYYYKSKHQQKIINKLVEAMSDHGYLVTGETEKQMVTKYAGLKAVVPPSPIFQKQ